MSEKRRYTDHTEEEQDTERYLAQRSSNERGSTDPDGDTKSLGCSPARFQLRSRPDVRGHGWTRLDVKRIKLQLVDKEGTKPDDTAKTCSNPEVLRNQII